MMQDLGLVSQKNAISWKLTLCQFRGENLRLEILKLSRIQLIDWLKWRDPDGVYEDRESRKELGNVISKKDAIQITIKFIEDPDCIRMLAYSAVIKNSLNVQ